MAPPTFQERQRAERAARMAALRERVRLGTVDDYRFEVFEEIHRLGIWLMFQPLTNLYGFYQRTKPESTRRACGIGVWGRVAAGLVRVCGPARFGACRTGVRGLVRLVALGVRLRCAGR